MRIISIINQKGGSCKTTTTVNLAGALSQLKKKVLVIDMDPQASASAWFGANTTDKSLLSVMTENVNINSVIKDTNNKNIKIISSSSWLIRLEKILANEVGAETILRDGLKLLNQNDFDYVLIDCPPTLGILTINILTAAREVLVPVEARIMALAGLVQLLQTIDIVKNRLNSELKVAGIVACRVDVRTRHSKEILEELRTKFGELVYNTAIRENIKLSEAPSFAKTIFDYDLSSNGAYDYLRLAKEVVKQESKIDFVNFNSKNINQATL